MAEAQKRVGPIDFVRQVRQEGRKVTWTTRRETLITTIMVFVMVILSAVFFLIVDAVISTSIQFFLSLGG